MTPEQAAESIKNYRQKFLGELRDIVRIEEKQIPSNVLNKGYYLGTGRHEQLISEIYRWIPELGRAGEPAAEAVRFFFEMYLDYHMPESEAVSDQRWKDLGQKFRNAEIVITVHQKIQVKDKCITPLIWEEIADRLVIIAHRILFEQEDKTDESK